MDSVELRRLLGIVCTGPLLESQTRSSWPIAGFTVDSWGLETGDVGRSLELLDGD